MRNKVFSLLVFVLLATTLSAQQRDTLESIIPQPLDTLPSATVISADDYLEEGYYDGVARLEQIPTVDSTAFLEMQGRYRSDEFNYEEEALQTNILERVWKRIGTWIQNLMPDMSYLEFGDWFYKLLAVIAIVVLILIIYRVLFSGNRLLAHSEKASDEETEIKFVEKNLMDVDLMNYIEQAAKDNNYALAIRYLNLLNIQLLARKELIKWKHTKTNVELIEEIDHVELKQEFERNVHIFNRVWFGNMILDKAKYEEYARYFLQFQSKWK